MIDEEIVKISQRYTAAASEAALWLPLMQRVYYYVLPQKNDWYEPLAGQERLPPLYDSTAMLALDQFTGEVTSTLLPEDYQFVQLKPGTYYEEDEEEHGQAAEYFSNLTDYFFELLGMSNFYQVRAECLEDWGSHGTGCMIFNENDDDDNPFMFHVAPLRLLAFEQGANGQIQTLWRKHENFLIVNITEHWPRANVPDVIMRPAMQDPTTKMDLLEGIVWDAKRKQYRYMLTDTQFQEVFMDYWDITSPAIVFRYAVTTGELFGRGLGVRALNWIQIVNMICHDEITMGEFATNSPVMATSDSIANLNTLRVMPGAIIPVKPTPDGKGFPVQKWPAQSDWAYTQMQITDLRIQIEKMFFADQPQTPAGTQPVTATEIVSRNKKAAQRFGVAYSRFGAEFYIPFMKRALHIMNKRGLIPPIEINGKLQPLIADGRIAKIKISPPLANAEGLRKAETFQNYNMLMQSVFQENTPGIYNITKLPQEVAEWMNFDPSLVKNEYEMTKAIQAIAAQKQEQARLQQLAANPTKMGA